MMIMIVALGEYVTKFVKLSKFVLTLTRKWKSVPVVQSSKVD